MVFEMIKQLWEFKKDEKKDSVLVLTVSLAGVIDPGEVLVTAAFVGAFGVVADVGTHSELQTLILIWKNWEPI